MSMNDMILDTKAHELALRHCEFDEDNEHYRFRCLNDLRRFVRDALSYQSSGEAKEPVAVSNDQLRKERDDLLLALQEVEAYAMEIGARLDSVAKTAEERGSKFLSGLLETIAVQARLIAKRARLTDRPPAASAAEQVGQPSAVPHGEPVAWMRTDADGEHYFSTKQPAGLGDWRWIPLYAAPVAAPVVPDAVTAWHAAEKTRIDAVAAYNARLNFVREHCPFGTSVDHEYQAMEEARRKAFSLLAPMFEALSATLSAAPVAQSVPDTAQPQAEFNAWIVCDPYAGNCSPLLESFDTKTEAEEWLREKAKEDHEGYDGCIVMAREDALKEYRPARPVQAAQPQEPVGEVEKEVKA